jgi:rRNA maturation protein Nop10
MQENCPKCRAITENSKPAKYSPDDLYGDYRRKAKEEMLKEKGLI